MVYILFGILLLIIVILCIKIRLLKKSAREISEKFADSLETDTNTVIGISTRDKDMQQLAADINTQLKKLREEHIRYDQGDTELKNAITNISHDLRTPLTAIYGYLDMLEKTEDGEKRARYIGIMKERAQTMKQLTEELFRYSIILADEQDLLMEDIFVNQLLAESVGGFYPALTEKSITPNIKITDERIVRRADKTALARVFSNLLNNAVKYSDGDLEIVLEDDGVITFSNTAKSLSAVEVEQLFDRFYTVEVARDSTGLGLAIARTLVERMGGTITAEYTDGIFTIKITL